MVLWSFWNTRNQQLFETVLKKKDLGSSSRFFQISETGGYKNQIPAPHCYLPTQSPYQTVWTHSGASSFLGLLVPGFWRGFRTSASGLKTFNLEFSHQEMRRWRWWERDCNWVGRSRGDCIWLYLWGAREKLPRVFAQCLLHRHCSNSNRYVQDLGLF
jgi:hypothetical protein